MTGNEKEKVDPVYSCNIEQTNEIPELQGSAFGSRRFQGPMEVCYIECVTYR